MSTLQLDAGERVHWRLDGDVAVVTIDNPPINAGSVAVRRGLLEAVDALGSDPQVAAIVLIGQGGTFVAGSDLKEFGLPLEEPQLPVVQKAIFDCSKPVIAAIDGAALGGGLELALACDYRVAVPGAIVGLPEVTLGMIPGAGGTQWLPRLVGRVRAAQMICTGERIDAARALVVGIIDAVLDGDLRQVATTYARGCQGKRRIGDLPVPKDDAEDFDAAAAKLLKAGRNRPAVAAAVRAVRQTNEIAASVGLASERAVFQQLRVSDDARALRHVFFAERQATKAPGLPTVAKSDLATIAVVGAGTMGRGIAICALDSGCNVLLAETDEASTQAGVEQIANWYRARIETGKLDGSAATSRLKRLTPAVDWTALHAADLVVEAVFEDLDVKRDVFRRLSEVCRPDAVLATNTSYLDIDDIAAATDRAGRVIGLHFFSPPQVMRLVEVVKGRDSEPGAVASGITLAKRLGKLPVVTGNAFGFIGNRIYAAYRRQCEFMVEEGAMPHEVDAALEAWGFAMGPFAVGDLSGLDIAWRMRKARAAQQAGWRATTVADRLCEIGRFGRKTGGGYYRYDADGKRERDPLVEDIVLQESQRAGITRRAFTASDIQRRALLAMVNEAALLTAEGVATHVEDIDVALVNGFGFPRWQGGPVWWARQQGINAIRAGLDALSAVSGAGFQQGVGDRLFPATHA